MQLTPEELTLLRLIVKWFNENKRFVSCYDARQEITVSNDQYDVLMKRMHEFKAIQIITCESEPGRYATNFVPLAKSVDLLEQYEQEQVARSAPPDIFKQIKNYIHTHPWITWPIIVFYGLALLVPMLNNSRQLIERIINWFR